MAVDAAAGDSKMPASAIAYHDPLEQLNRAVPLHEKVRAIHWVIQERLDSIDRIAAAVYDPRSDLLKTFVASAADDDLPLRHYQGPLSDSPSLCEILRSGSPRVIDDLTALGNPPSAPHTRHLIELGYASSYTMPMCCHGALLRLLFFDSCRKGRFDAETRHALDVFGHLIALVIIHDLSRLRTLAGAVVSCFTVIRPAGRSRWHNVVRMTCAPMPSFAHPVHRRGSRYGL
jgi:transcriptional regulator with GAF, ATPase, and Fis domain